MLKMILQSILKGTDYLIEAFPSRSNILFLMTRQLTKGEEIEMHQFKMQRILKDTWTFKIANNL